MILNYVFTGLLVVASLILQGHPSFGMLGSFFGVKPDIMFIVIVYLGFTYGAFYGEVVGFIGGLLIDCMSSSPLGLMAFPKMVIGLLAGLFGRSMFKSTFLTIIIIVGIGSLIKGVITMLLAAIFSHTSFSAITSVILPETIYNVILSYPLFWIFDKIYQPEVNREGN